MIGVKLTIVLLIITFLSTFIVKAIVAGLDFKTKLLIGLDQGPKWFENILVFQGTLVCLDFIGVIYSVIWLLFFR
uniref:Uncharacterized protein n=1 Tax=Siphoviridae sp. ctmYS12 TaxID=2825652 RepID=A0A8S5P8M6_9CAUD|nr:MAG TPA: hypothetical protein [Siphoviridae sp. ctmYS12]